MITIKLDGVVADELRAEIADLAPKSPLLKALGKALRQARKQPKGRITIKATMATRHGISTIVDFPH